MSEIRENSDTDTENESMASEQETKLTEDSGKSDLEELPQIPRRSLKDILYVIIFEADTAGGKAFDVALLIFILGSVIVVMLDSVKSLNLQYNQLFRNLEWLFTIVFTLEYGLRVYCSPNRKRYMSSFFGLIDLFSILPTYLAIILTGAQYMMIVRILRLLRLFRIFKLGRFLKEADTMLMALKASGPKISVFLFSVLSVVSIVGALMYLIESDEAGFTDIPRSIYWCIVTITTVGYGDIAPRTVLGQILACTVMILGYGIIAVPTGIVSVEIHKATKGKRELLNCNNCGAKEHQESADYCNKCGTKLTRVAIKQVKDP